MALVKRVYADGNTVITAQNLNDIQDEVIATSDVIAAEYDSTADYLVGDYCMHDSKLYVCGTAITGGEDWNSSHWSEVTVESALVGLEGEIEDLNEVTGDVGDLSGFTATDLVGACNELKGNITDTHGLPSGGTSGQVLKKTSSTNYDVAWGDPGEAITEIAVATGIQAYKQGKFCIIRIYGADFRENGYIGLPSELATSGMMDFMSIGGYASGTGYLMVWGNVLSFNDYSGAYLKVNGVYGEIAYYTST